MTKSEIIDFKGSSEDLEQDSDDYFAVLAYESHGLAIRDNSLAEWVMIGRRFEEFSEEFE